jgi:hypothetical protein
MKIKNKIILGVVACLAFVASVFAQTTAIEGKKVTFSVAADGTTPFTYAWKKGTVALSGTATYVINSVSLSDAGTYSVTVSNSAGNDTASAVLVVWQLPLITTQPTATSVAIGASASFSAAASGFPTPTFQWFKGGTAIAGATSSTLSIPSISQGDVGNYTVVATNSAGNVTSAVASLSVTVVAPKITSLIVTVQ